MTGIEKYLDDMFDALYGETIDENGNKYSDEYQYECKNVCNDIVEYFEILSKYSDIVGVGVGEVKNIIIISEQMHIGNDLQINHARLRILARKILCELKTKIKIER